ncbi:MAG TPA: methyltransferase domain-containing protein, partial [Coleofasciculaceae cyanobacterium]
MKILKLVYDNEQSNSWATNIRKKRLALFNSLIESIPSPVNILDVGGTQTFWDTSGFFDENMDLLKITLMNVRKVPVSRPNFNSIVGDARNMKNFKDNQFDVIFSNSVIEHVGDYNAQLQMANEIKRVGKRYFVQTPNLYFPIEPHFVFPFFQFLPVEVRVWLISHFDLGFYEKITDQKTAIEAVTSITLLNKKKFISLFPEANLFEEKIF